MNLLPNNIPLPGKAKAKLVEIVAERDSAVDLAQVTTQRLKQLPPGDPLAGRLRTLQGRQIERRDALQAIARELVAYVERLPDTAMFVMAEPVEAKPRDGMTIAETVEQLRDEIEGVKNHLLLCAAAPLPKANLKALVREHVAQLAAYGRPTVRPERGQRVRIDFSGLQSSYGFGPQEVFSILCAFDGERMSKLLEAQVDALPDATFRHAMTAAEQTQRTAQLEARLDQLEREEEGLIEAAATEGLEIMRRENASPAAVLDVVRKQRVAQAA